MGVIAPSGQDMQAEPTFATHANARFLIIDDHPLFREALHSAVRMAYPLVETIEATTVAEGLEILAGKQGFDLALLDLNVPGVQGFAGLLQIEPSIPACLWSSSSQDMRTIG
jgi:DNA-binding NarL/FixJ family response regulator